jgi:hypothetical protein
MRLEQPGHQRRVHANSQNVGHGWPPAPIVRLGGAKAQDTDAGLSKLPRFSNSGEFVWISLALRNFGRCFLPVSRRWSNADNNRSNRIALLEKKTKCPKREESDNAIANRTIFL